MSNLLEKLYSEVPKAKDVVYSISGETPLEEVSIPDFDFDLYIKREDLGPINAYKWRGGYNAVYNHHQNTGCETIVAASAGNHAQGVALAAQKLKIHAKIFMPLAAPLMKQDAVKKHGGDYVELILTGDTYNEAGEAAKKYVAEHGYTYIHPFDDLYTMAGQALIADEVIHQSDAPFDYVFLQIGGGGMAGAVSAWLKKHWPDITVIGVEGEQQASMANSVKAGQPVTLDQVDTFCDGTAVTRPGDLTFEVCSQTIDGFVTVTNDEVSAAIQQLWNAKRLIPEPSGAMGLAGIHAYRRDNAALLKGKRVLSIICGANMDFNKLSIIAGKSADGSAKRHYYQLSLPEHKGQLLKVLEKHFSDFNVSEFMYGKVKEEHALQTIAIDGSAEDFERLETSLKQDNIPCKNITSKIDIRYKIVNYNPALFKHPLFVDIRFPERKGALRDFLRSIADTASICYFNYAYSGEVIGRALMGFEFDSADMHVEFMSLIEKTGVTGVILDQDTQDRILQH